MPFAAPVTNATFPLKLPFIFPACMLLLLNMYSTFLLHGRWLMRVQRQSFRKHLRVKDRRPLSAVSVVCHDIEVVGIRFDRHARGFQVVSFISAGQQDLSDWDGIVVEYQDT